MKVADVPALDLNLAKTLESGQVFHWEQWGNGFLGTIGDVPIFIEQHGDNLHASGDGEQLDRFKRSSLKALVSHYFALDHPLKEICKSFPRDPAMIAAADFCRGLRIIRQPKWECLATFICSSMKQVAHIRQISRALRQRFGDAREIAGRKVYTFPSAGRLAMSSESELRTCALGYRAKNLLGTARLVADGSVDLGHLRSLEEVDLRAALCRLPGVGAKVANCVMLFAYERLRAFPIDVWIARVLRENYFPRARKLNPARLQAFTDRYFGDYGGYAQQYLFHHARKTGRNRNSALRRPRTAQPLSLPE